MGSSSHLHLSACFLTLASSPNQDTSAAEPPKTLTPMVLADAASKGSQAWEALQAGARHTQAPEAWAEVHSAFYLTFWSLSFADLHFPASMYAA